MTSREITRANITAFIARAINHAGINAIDAEFGLRMQRADVTSLGNVVIEFEGGLALVLAGMPVTREIADVN